MVYSAPPPRSPPLPLFQVRVRIAVAALLGLRLAGMPRVAYQVACAVCCCSCCLPAASAALLLLPLLLHTATRANDADLAYGANAAAAAHDAAAHDARAAAAAHAFLAAQ